MKSYQRSKREGLSLSLAMKMSIGFAIVLLIFTAVSMFTHSRLDALAQKDAQERILAQRQQTALALKSLVEQMDAAATGYMLSGKVDLAEQYKESIPELNRLTEAVGASATTKEQRNWRSRLTMVSKEFTANFERVADTADQSNVNPEQQRSSMVAAYNASQIHKQVMFELVQSFYNDYHTADLEARKQFGALIISTRSVTLWATAAGIALAIAVAAFVVRSLTLGIRKLRLGIEYVKDGDLTKPIAAANRDELGRLSESFDMSVAAVRGMLEKTKRIAESLTEHSDHFRQFAGTTKETNSHIVRAMEEIAAGAAKQAEHTETSATSIMELEQRMDGIFTATEVLIASSESAKQSVDAATEGVNALQLSSERTGGALRTMSETLHRLERRSGEIADITNSIHAISQQTNILALNAAIESARAGVHGRGFSVIAEEVRLLSLQTTESSRQIDDILGQLRSGVTEAAKTLQLTANSFTAQQDNVRNSGETFRRIVQFIEGFETEVARIADRVREARHKQAELVDSVQIVASVAQETAAGVEETAAASISQDEAVMRIVSEAEDIHQLAEALFEEIDKFKM